MFNTEVLQYAKPNEASDEEVFANIYHSLAHSPLAATMIQLEHSHAGSVTKSDELESTSNSEDDWERVCRVSNASHVREIQRREFRQWIQTVHEDSSSDVTNKDIDGKCNYVFLKYLSFYDEPFLYFQSTPLSSYSSKFQGSYYYRFLKSGQIYY